MEKDEREQKQEVNEDKLLMDLLDKKIQESENNLSKMSDENLILAVSQMANICRTGDSPQLSAKKMELSDAVTKVVIDRIVELDERLEKAKGHIEYPESDARIEYLQKTIEQLETELGKTQIFSRGEKSISASRLETLSVHRQRRIENEGVDMSEITSFLESRDIPEEYVQKNDTPLNPEMLAKYEQEIRKKTDYLENKLARIEEHRNIPGNEERIKEIEKQIEFMQDTLEAQKIGAKQYEDGSPVIGQHHQERLEKEKTEAQQAENERRGKEEANKKAEEAKELERKAKELAKERYEIEIANKAEHQRNEASLEELDTIAKLDEEWRKKYPGANITAKRIEWEQELTAQFTQKYKLEDIKSSEQLQSAVMNMIRDGVELKAKATDQEGMRRLQIFKAVVPNFEQLKANVVGVNFLDANSGKKLFEGFDLQHVTYDDINKKAESILEQERIAQAEKAKAEYVTKVEAPEVPKAPEPEKESVVDVPKVQQTPEPKKETAVEVPKVQQMPEPEKETAVDIPEVQKVLEQEPVVSRQKPVVEQTQNRQEPDIIKQEKTINNIEQSQELSNKKSPEAWIERFNKWNTAIDRVAQEAKQKFIKMKDDIVNAIKNLTKEKNRTMNDHEKDERNGR